MFLSLLDNYDENVGVDSCSDDNGDNNGRDEEVPGNNSINSYTNKIINIILYSARVDNNIQDNVGDNGDTSGDNGRDEEVPGNNNIKRYTNKIIINIILYSVRKNYFFHSVDDKGSDIIQEAVDMLIIIPAEKSDKEHMHTMIINTPHVAKCPKHMSKYKRPRRMKPWVQCSKCEQWYHCKCAGITLQEAERRDTC